jgi:hypothetical protein
MYIILFLYFIKKDEEKKTYQDKNKQLIATFRKKRKKESNLYDNVQKR